MKYIVVKADNDHNSDEVISDGEIYDINLSHVVDGMVTLDRIKMCSIPFDNFHSFYWFWRFKLCEDFVSFFESL